MTTVYCPKCGSLDIADKESIEVLEPRYYCNSCKASFGNNGGHSIYDDIVKEIYLDINGFFTDRVTLDVHSLNEGASYSITSKNKDISYKGTIAINDWEALTRNLFDDCFLGNWKRIYYSSRILDGTTWHIAVKLKRKHTLNFHGCNGFPPYWNRFIEYLSPLFNEAGIAIEEFLI